MKKVLNMLVAIFLSITILSSNAYASSEEVVSLGNDISEEQRKEILDILGASYDARIVRTTNEEEVEYLGKYVDRKILGYKTMSSAYVKPMKKGYGIKVETHNINWVTEDMIISALTTAGVKDAYVKVAAPFPVSGTGALTGIMKSFEYATGESIDEVGKHVASQEIVTTGELAEDIGSDEASSIINRVKEEVVEGKISNPEEIKKIIEDASKDINIELTEEQKEKITDLMEKISKLDLNVEDIKNQLKNISDKLKDLNEKTEEVKSIVAKILDFVKKIFEKIQSLFK